MKRGTVLKYTYITLGSLSFLLAIIGVVMPLLPTTPFLLLSAWLFIRSSKRLYIKLINSPYFGRIIINYRQKRGIGRLEKTVSITLLWGTISYSALFVTETLWLQILLFAIAIGVTWHLLSLPTLRK